MSDKTGDYLRNFRIAAAWRWRLMASGEGERAMGGDNGDDGRSPPWSASWRRSLTVRVAPLMLAWWDHARELRCARSAFGCQNRSTQSLAKWPRGTTCL